MRIGVLASQGAFAEHIAILRELEVEAVPVRLPHELDGLDGLIIPGGETTTIIHLITDYDLAGKIKNIIQNGLPVMGTCAGMIVISNGNSNTQSDCLGVMDIKVKRNAFGRQKESFETELAVPVLGDEPFHGVFIRAPLIEKVNNDKVQILSKLSDGGIVAARQDKMLALSFHPELTDDLRFHRYFLDIVDGQR